MRVWTVQTEDAYSRLLEKGVLYGDWRRVGETFKKPYEWLCEQMEAHGIALHGHPPIWAWPHKPDLRKRWLAESKQRSVRIEVEISDNLVLFSNYEAWHCALNNYWLGEEDLETMWDQPHDKVVASWKGMFDLDYCSRIGFGTLAQVTFPSLNIDDVLSARPFVAR